MKLRPTSTTPASHCVRCNAAFSELVGQVRATCSPCATALALLHKQQEYTMYRRTYYLCSTEGTSYQWLIDNGYGKEVTLSYGPPRGVPMVQAPPVDQVLVNSS